MPARLATRPASIGLPVRRSQTAKRLQACQAVRDASSAREAPAFQQAMVRCCARMMHRQTQRRHVAAISSCFSLAVHAVLAALTASGCCVRCRQPAQLTRSAARAHDHCSIASACAYLSHFVASACSKSATGIRCDRLPCRTTHLRPLTPRTPGRTCCALTRLFT